MASPLGLDRLLPALRAEGVRYYEYSNWRTHNRNHKGPWGPVHGVMIHHTVSSGDDGSVALCYNGHSDLPGPLCHAVGRNDGKVALVGHGRANHAGLGDPDVLQAVIDETDLPADNEATVDGNRHFYGIEIVNRGDGEDTYPWVQYVQAVKWATALCRAHGWSEKSVIGHKGWQPGKIDPYGPVVGPDGSRFDFTMSRFRADVKAALALPAGRWGNQEEEDVALTDAEIEKIARKVWTIDGVIDAQEPPYNNSDFDTNKHWGAKYQVYTSVRAGRETLARVKDVESDVAEIKSRLDSIAVGGVDLDALAEKVADKLAERLSD